jgi:hypothetical protein
MTKLEAETSILDDANNKAARSGDFQMVALQGKIYALQTFTDVRDGRLDAAFVTENELPISGWELINKQDCYLTFPKW